MGSHMRFRVASLTTMEMDFTRTGPTAQMHGWYLQERRRQPPGLAFSWMRWGKEPEDRKRLCLAALALCAPGSNSPAPFPFFLPP